MPVENSKIADAALNGLINGVKETTIAFAAIFRGATWLAFTLSAIATIVLLNVVAADWLSRVVLGQPEISDAMQWVRATFGYTSIVAAITYAVLKITSTNHRRTSHDGENHGSRN